ncbi:hypothetical protein [Candidatus Electronema sp. JC]|uniref:hypothetical protein n=1 Tax=Candidatus Electronema sp. JC TaxID=3401570 RepID=UPI003B42F750
MSLEDVVKWELMRVKDSIKSSREITSLIPGSKSIITNEEFDGNMYLIKRTFFFKNGLGYVVGFTATAGTYEKNLSNYDLLLPSISFQTPSRISIEINLEKTSNSIDFIYNIFTPKHDEINENIAYVSVGWNLWQELRNNADVNQLESVDILYPSLNGDAGKHKNEYTGRLFLKPRAINEFFIILCREKKVGDRIRIESLPKDKIEKFWEIINFEASEPILQVEFNNKSYVLNLIDCNGKTGIYIEKIDKQDI